MAPDPSLVHKTFILLSSKPITTPALLIHPPLTEPANLAQTQCQSLTSSSSPASGSSSIPSPVEGRGGPGQTHLLRDTPHLYSHPADLGNRLTELTKTVSRLQSEVAGVQRAVVEAGPCRPPRGASILSRYITRVRNSFQNLGPPIPETPELTTGGTQGSSESGLPDAGGAQAPASGESGPSSPAHVLVHREQESEGAGDLPQEADLGVEEGT